MELTTLCAVVATLRVVPDRSQFFQYESINLICEWQGNATGWMIMRNTSTKANEVFKVTEGDGFHISDLYPSDSGVYWCKSGTGERSNTVTITVTAGFVILESPAVPVANGQAVTMYCRQSPTLSSNVTAEFYKDGRHIGSSSAGNLTISSVSKADEGLYRCNIFGAGESPDSWLSVKEAGHSKPSELTLALILLPVVIKAFLLISLTLTMLSWRRHKDKSLRRRRRPLSAVPRHRPGRSLYTSQPVPTFRDF